MQHEKFDLQMKPSRLNSAKAAWTRLLIAATCSGFAFLVRDVLVLEQHIKAQVCPENKRYIVAIQAQMNANRADLVRKTDFRDSLPEEYVANVVQFRLACWTGHDPLDLFAV